MRELVIQKIIEQEHIYVPRPDWETKYKKGGTAYNREKLLQQGIDELRALPDSELLDRSLKNAYNSGYKEGFYDAEKIDDCW